MPFVKDEIIEDYDMRVTVEPVSWFRRLPGVRSWFPYFTGDRPLLRIKMEDAIQSGHVRTKDADVMIEDADGNVEERRVITYKLYCIDPRGDIPSKWSLRPDDDNLGMYIGRSVERQSKMLTETGHYTLYLSLSGETDRAVASIPVVSRAVVLVGILYVLVTGLFTLIGAFAASLPQWLGK